VNVKQRNPLNFSVFLSLFLVLLLMLNNDRSIRHQISCVVCNSDSSNANVVFYCRLHLQVWQGDRLRWRNELRASCSFDVLFRTGNVRSLVSSNNLFVQTNIYVVFLFYSLCNRIVRLHFIHVCSQDMLKIVGEHDVCRTKKSFKKD